MRILCTTDITQYHFLSQHHLKDGVEHLFIGHHHLFFVVISFLIIAFSLAEVKSQQLPSFSQYTFNAFLLNPAVAGAEGYTSVNLTNREQWLGIPGAPRTCAISLQTRIMKRDYVESNASVAKRYLQPLRSGRVGLGVFVYNDHAGLIDQTGAQFTYAYHLASAKSQLSFGLTFSLLQYKINSKDMKLYDNDDPYNNQRMEVYIPDANIGIYYSDQTKFFGLSILQLAEASANISTYKNNEFLIYRNFYLTSGYKYELSEQNVLEPSFYLKTTQQGNIQMDVTMKFIHDSKFWLGFAYRTGFTYIGTVGVRLDRLYVGYGYDYSPKGLLSYSSGSHEIMLALKLGDNVRRYKWIDRY